MRLTKKVLVISLQCIVKTLDNPNIPYESFFDIFFKTYNKYFPKVRIKVKAKTIQNPWITKGIKNSSKKNYIHYILLYIRFGQEKLIHM